MKKERKECLLCCFPEVPLKFSRKMEGKGTQNFVVFLTRGRELFARCFHRYYNGEIIESQRYVFAKDGAVRYGKGMGKWTSMKELREPAFVRSYGYNYNNCYSVMGWEAIAKSDMRYSQVKEYQGGLVIAYLCLYCRHPNIEYLVKAGYEDVIEEHTSGYWSYRPDRLRVMCCVDLKSNNLLKMLGLNRTEFKELSGHEKDYSTYLRWREAFPKLLPEERMLMLNAYSIDVPAAERAVKHTGLNPVRIARYLEEHSIQYRDYDDHIRQCLQLGYDLHDTAYSLPHDFYAFHGRNSAMIRYNTDKLMNEAFAENYEKRKTLEFRSGELIIVQPPSCDDIIREGKLQKHCVGGYAERHAYGKLHILFLRKVSEPEKPYYTMEVSTEGQIVQCRGYCNDRGRDKPAEVLEFERIYQQYLDEIFGNKRRKTA